MNLYEAIFVRKSVRSYIKEELNPMVLQDILLEFDDIKSLFGGIETEITILDNTKGQYKMMGLFGPNAPYYLAIYSEEKDRAMMNAGYIMEQMALYLCTQGLGSCFIGKPILKKKEMVRGEKHLMAVLAFGKAKGSCVRKAVDAKRLSLNDLCVFKETPRQWIKQLLDAARMAPSSMNSQPWRFVVFDSRIHIFTKKNTNERLGKYNELNFGILFSHMMVVADELWLDVDLIRLDEISQKNFPNNQYVLSAIMRS